MVDPVRAIAPAGYSEEGWSPSGQTVGRVSALVTVLLIDLQQPYPRRVASQSAAKSSSWGLPAGSVVLAVLALPLMFVSPMSFVVALAVAVGGSIGGLWTALDDQRSKAQRLVGCVACFSVPAAVTLLALPFALQN